MAGIRVFWITLRSSLWFVPSVSVLAAMVLALGLVEIDSRQKLELSEHWPNFFGLGADGSRSILATIAQSVITIAGVTFSITIVALSLAANQYTPRVLRNFMRDRGNQFVLGGLVGIFVYCLIVLRTIQGGQEPFIPAISVTLALVSALVAVGLFIYFIHHVATTIQAAAIICSIAEETQEVIRGLLPEEAPPGSSDCDLSAEEQRLLAKGEWQAIPGETTGYLQTVDLAGLHTLAKEHRVIIKMQPAIGDFIIEGKPLVWIHPVNTFQAESFSQVSRLFSIKAYRTIEQDPLFGISQIVDIAVKALSPGINDPTTAVTCVHYLASILCLLIGRHIPPRCEYEDGRLCVVNRRPNFERILDLSLDSIRQHSGTQPGVLISILKAIEEIATVPCPVLERKQHLLKHAELVLRMAEQNISFPPDLQKIRVAADRCCECMGGGIAGQAL